jgi:hypothetical protein
MVWSRIWIIWIFVFNPLDGYLEKYGDIPFKAIKNVKIIGKIIECSMLIKSSFF